jgi:hypothetical protein
MGFPLLVLVVVPNSADALTRFKGIAKAVLGAEFIVIKVPPVATFIVKDYLWVTWVFEAYMEVFVGVLVTDFSF